VHTYIENEVMYPQVRELLPDLGEDVLESYEEDHVADLCAPSWRAQIRTATGSTPRLWC
jgi:hypothetical protein